MESGWDDAILAPTKSCPSPRLNALGVVTNSPTNWDPWNGTFIISEERSSRRGCNRTAAATKLAVASLLFAGLCTFIVCALRFQRHVPPRQPLQSSDLSAVSDKMGLLDHIQAQLAKKQAAAK